MSTAHQPVGANAGSPMSAALRRPPTSPPAPQPPPLSMAGANPTGLPLAAIMQQPAQASLVAQYYQMMAEKMWGAGAAGLISPPGSDSGAQQPQQPALDKSHPNPAFLNGQGELNY